MLPRLLRGDCSFLVERSNHVSRFPAHLRRRARSRVLFPEVEVVMSDLNLTLLHWLAAGNSPEPAPLLFARLFALWGAWACAFVIGWCAWRRRSQTAYLLAMALGAGVASVLSHAIAARLNVPRPFVAGWVPAYISHNSSASLPSTHAAVMSFIAFALLLRADLRKAGAVTFLLACAVGWARIYVGVHYPLDIAAGMALGALLAAVLALIWHFTHPTAANAERMYGGAS